MYKNFFGLRENPFNVNPDPRFLYLTPQTREALDELTYGIQNRKGLILLTGEVGTERKWNQVTSLATPPLPLTHSRTEDEASSTAKSSPISLTENLTLTLASELQ